MMLSRSTRVVGLDMNLGQVVGRRRSRGVFQMRSSRDSHQDWEKSDKGRGLHIGDTGSWSVEFELSMRLI